MELDEGVFTEAHRVRRNPGINKERSEIHGGPEFLQGVQ
jgi:hypothetical protein